MLCIPCKSIQS